MTNESIHSRRNATPPMAIVGGTVIDPQSHVHDDLNVFVRDGVIIEVSKRAPAPDEHTVNAKGCIVAP